MGGSIGATNAGVDENTARPALPAPSGMAGTTSVPVPSTPTAPTVPQVGQRIQPVPVESHHSLLGRAFSSLYESMGQGPPKYHVDPETGQTVRDEQPPGKPGQFFRNILAASILGAAAGQDAHARNPSGGFAGGMAAGANAEMGELHNQDDLARKRAADDWQRAQEIKKQKMEEERQKSELDLHKAQIAEANANTARINMETQGSDFRMHQEVVTAGRANESVYREAGLQPISGTEGISESDMAAFLKRRPEAISWDWIHTGLRTTIGPDGKPQYEYTYSAYEPHGKVALTGSALAQWKKDGMEKYYPEITNMKPGQQLDVMQFIQLKRLDEGMFADNIKRTKDRLDIEEKKAQIDRTNLEISKLQLEKKDKQDLETAEQELSGVNGDVSKLGAKSKSILAKYAQTMVKEFNDSMQRAYEIYKGAVTAGGEQSDDARGALQEYQTLQGARDMWLKIGGLGAGQGTAAPGAAAPAATPAPPPGFKVQEVVLAHMIARAKTYGMTPDQIGKIASDLNAMPSPQQRQDYIAKLQVSPEAKAEITRHAVMVTKAPPPGKTQMVFPDGSVREVPNDQVKGFQDSKTAFPYQQ